jgi:ATP/maltotriose-dependent transcriptional regulator MalT
MKKRIWSTAGKIRGEREAGKRSFSLEAGLHAALVEQARLEQVLPDDLAAELIATGLRHRQANEGLMRLWERLTAREQQVTALACLGYSNRQIGGKLGIAESTVKIHIGKTYMKLNLRRKKDLLKFFIDWDFSDWDKCT